MEQRVAAESSRGSVYSDEGTAAHALAALCFAEGKHPAAYVGRVLHVVNGVYTPDFEANFTEPPEGVDDHRVIDITNGKGMRAFTVDTDMAGHVNTYIQSVKEYAGDGEVLTEERVPIGHITGEAGAAGTSDNVAFRDDELQVHDLKYGMGVKVYAKENPQGLLYLLGALEKFEVVYGKPKRFRFVIHQPRLGHLDDWDCSYAELMAFSVKAQERAAHAMRVLNNEKPEAYIHHLVAGNHCKENFCRARADCPKLAKFVADTVGADFEVVAANGAASVPPVPDDLVELGSKLAALDVIQDWCKQVRAKGEAALITQLNSLAAQTALGYKLVQGKKGNRQWVDSEAIEALLKKKRLKTEEIYDLSVKSPTAITKALADKPKWLVEIEAHITQSGGKPSVQPITDKRPALVLTEPAADFDVIEPDTSDLA